MICSELLLSLLFVHAADQGLIRSGFGTSLCQLECGTLLLALTGDLHFKAFCILFPQVLAIEIY